MVEDGCRIHALLLPSIRLVDSQYANTATPLSSQSSSLRLSPATTPFILGSKARPCCRTHIRTFVLLACRRFHRRRKQRPLERPCLARYASCLHQSLQRHPTELLILTSRPSTVAASPPSWQASRIMSSWTYIALPPAKFTSLRTSLSNCLIAAPLAVWTSAPSSPVLHPSLLRQPWRSSLPRQEGRGCPSQEEERKKTFV